MVKALFLDRDGVINIDHGYLYRINDFEFVPGILELCRRFYDDGYKLLVVTNQSGIARGYYTESDFDTLTDWLKQRFTDNQSPLEEVYFCPHGPSENCPCRKPRPGMLRQAEQAHNISLPDSVMIGDKLSDMQAAHHAGIGRRILFVHEQQLPEDTGLATEVHTRLEDISTNPSGYL